MARLAAERWDEIVAEAETSGAPHTAVAARHRVSLPALKYHVYKARKAGRHGSPRLLPVRVGEERLILQVQCGLIRLTFPEGCEPAYVAAVVAGISKIAC